MEYLVFSSFESLCHFFYVFSLYDDPQIEHLTLSFNSSKNYVQIESTFYFEKSAFVLKLSHPGSIKRNIVA